MSKLKNVYIFFVILFWPVSLYLSNTHSDFYFFFIPAVFLAAAYFLHKKHLLLSNLFIILIGIFSVKLILFPIMYFTVSFFIKPSRSKIIFLISASLILLFNWTVFKSQTVFQKDYEAQQQILRDTQLYDSVFIARLFHNKVRIPLEKVTNNFFSLIDPNNYFFAFHPRENIRTQNIQKLPFLSILFFFAGLYFTTTIPNKNFLVAILGSGVIALSLLSSFDRNDIVLWFPIGLIVIHGIQSLKISKQYEMLIFVTLILFAIIEITRLLYA